ncbi:MAG: hypothetical protein DWI11_03615 [Planctomycetota bacterium]|nr:MAG: hypothetical protein DWI11_03615 [Planctomycetota bacterium]
MHTTPALSLQPLAKSERISGVDIARGVALLGILLVNARYFFWRFRNPCGLMRFVDTNQVRLRWNMIALRKRCRLR